METNKISVIVPIYNIEPYIDNTVNSIRKQNFRNLEIILVDDGSADNSGGIIDFVSKADDRIKVIHQRNGGVTEARIAGIKAASGNWITFVDGDDYIEQDMYRTLLDNALEFNADISHCGYRMVFPSRVDYYYNTTKKIVQGNLQGLRDLLSGDFVEPCLCIKLFKSDIVKTAACSGDIDFSIKYNEDLLMNYYFFKQAHSSVYYDVCPYYYMLREGSAATSNISEKKLNDPIAVQKIIIDDIEKDSQLMEIVLSRLASLYINGASMKKLGNEPYIQNYIDMCRSELKSLRKRRINGEYNRSTKLKCALCNFSPMLYRFLHVLYAKGKGTDKKYEVR